MLETRTFTNREGIVLTTNHNVNLTDYMQTRMFRLPQIGTVPEIATVAICSGITLGIVTIIVVWLFRRMTAMRKGVPRAAVASAALGVIMAGLWTIALFLPPAQATLIDPDGAEEEFLQGIDTTALGAEAQGLLAEQGWEPQCDKGNAAQSVLCGGTTPRLGVPVVSDTGDRATATVTIWTETMVDRNPQFLYSNVDRGKHLRYIIWHNNQVAVPFSVTINPAD